MPAIPAIVLLSAALAAQTTPPETRAGLKNPKVKAFALDYLKQRGKA